MIANYNNINGINNQYPHFLYEYPSTYAMKKTQIGDSTAYMNAVHTITSETLLYIHIPFCYKICAFCNIYTTQYTSKESVHNYVEKILSELREILKNINPSKITGIYIGGGTPTILSSQQFKTLFDLLESFLGDISKLYIEIDAHPSTISDDLLDIFTKYWVKQLAIGIQSMDPRVLSAIDRHHQSVEILKKVWERLKNSSIRIHIDFIIWLPYENIKNILSWVDSVCYALSPSSISINRYDNTVDTKLHYQYRLLFQSKIYKKQTDFFINTVIDYTRKKYSIVRSLTYYFESFRKRHYHVLWVWSWAFGFISGFWYTQNSQYWEYIKNKAIERRILHDFNRQEERRMFFMHNYHEKNFFNDYHVLFGSHFIQDFPDFIKQLENLNISLWNGIEYLSKEYCSLIYSSDVSRFYDYGESYG